MLRASEMNGANVYNDQGNAIGTVNDLLVGDDGKIQNVGAFGRRLPRNRHPLRLGSIQPTSGAAEQEDNQHDGNQRGATGTGGLGAPAPGTATGSAAPGTAPAVTAAATNPPATTAEHSKTQDFSIVLPGSTKDLLTKMPEFHYNG